LVDLLVSPKTGLIRRLTIAPLAGGEIPLFYPVVDLPDYGRLPGMAAIDATGGAAFSARDSVARILFETAERYCAAFIDYDRMIWSQPVSGDFLHGPSFPLFADWQYRQPGWPFRRLEAGSNIWWSEARSLFSGRKRLVPSVFVHVPYRTTHAAECLGPSVSTGMAASCSWEEACLSGLLEVCERDAFTIMWMNGLVMPQIVAGENSALGRDVKRLLANTGARLSFVNLTNDLRIPTVMAVLRHHYLGQPVVTVGAAARMRFEPACYKAFAEAANGYARVVSELDTHGQWRAAPDFGDVTTFARHSLVYAGPDHQAALDFMLASPVCQPLEQVERNAPPDAGSQLECAVDLLREHFGEIVAVELTTREFASLGLHALKVMIPEAVPLHPDHRYPWLGHRRLHDVPARLGYPTASLNQYPHPFS
jgi:ribosomal protein S12 methylthiotransferase accessory factor